MLRDRLEREMTDVETPLGAIRFKVARRRDGRILNAAPEFEDCARIGRERRACRSRTSRRWRHRMDRGHGSEATDMARFYITTAIDYVNSRPHLGTAYEKIAADVIARYKRLCGFETHFVMGNDEHSQNVFKKARELGEDPLAYCDRMAGEFLEVWKRLDISFDDFIRTTEPRHRTGVQELVRRMTEAGDIYEGHLRRLVLRLAARRSSRRRISSTARARSIATRAGLDPGEELLLPALEVPRAAARSTSRPSRLPRSRTSGATRSCA